MNVNTAYPMRSASTPARAEQLQAARKALADYDLKDEYRAYCGQRNSHHGGGSAWMVGGLATGVATGTVAAEILAKSAGPLSAIGAFIACPVAGIILGAVMESRLQDKYMRDLHAGRDPLAQRVADLEAEKA